MAVATATSNVPERIQNAAGCSVRATVSGTLLQAVGSDEYTSSNTMKRAPRAWQLEAEVDVGRRERQLQDTNPRPLNPSRVRVEYKRDSGVFYEVRLPFEITLAKI